jgi:hypothetical protein
VHWKCIWWMHLLKNVKFVWHLFIHKFVFDSSTHFFCMSNIFSMHDIHMKNIQTYEWTNFARFSLLIWHKLKLWYFFISPYNYKLSLFFKNNSPNAAAVFLWLLLCCWQILIRPSTADSVILLQFSFRRKDWLSPACLHRSCSKCPSDLYNTIGSLESLGHRIPLAGLP